MTSYNLNKHGVPDGIHKAQYYMWYLGWKECRGLAGREFTEPIVKDLVIRRKNDDLPKLTMEVSKKELRIYQLSKGKYGRTDKVKFPTIPGKDITYAVQGLPPDEDVVACIYLGFNPTTRRAVHVHVYRCDTPRTAFTLAEHLTDIVRMPEHEDRIQSIEEQLTQRGEITPRPKNFINSYDADSVVTGTPSTVHTHLDNSLDTLSDSNSDTQTPTSGYGHGNEEDEEDPYQEEKEQAMESLANELRQRLGNKAKAPILLPPQDYDTVRRFRGNLDLAGTDEYESRKCKNEDIVGGTGSKEEMDRISREENGSENSGNSNEHLVQRRGHVRQSSMDNHLRHSTGSDGVGARTSGNGVPTNDVQVKSPWWVSHGQTFVPPTAGHPTSPNHTSPRPSQEGSYGSGGQRHRSPRRTRSPSPRRARGGSPVRYADDRRGRAGSPARPIDQPRHRSGSRGRYIDPPRFIMPYPAGTLPPPGALGPPGAMMPLGMMPPPDMDYGRLDAGNIPPPELVRGDPDYGRLPRQQSYPPADPYGNPQPNLSASMPASVLQQYTQKPSQKENKKKKKKKGKRLEEPPPDYTLHPSAHRKSGIVYS